MPVKQEKWHFCKEGWWLFFRKEFDKLREHIKTCDECYVQNSTTEFCVVKLEHKY